jgi:hypothetical protein
MKRKKVSAAGNYLTVAGVNIPGIHKLFMGQESGCLKFVD